MPKAFELPASPKTPEYRTWITNARNILAALSNRPEDAMKWLKAVGPSIEGDSYDALDEHQPFVLLDFAITSAFLKTTPPVDLSKSMDREERRLQALNRIVAGRRSLWHIGK
eukprot:14800897-Alexandrium_andersonii.AAC.1